MVFADCVHVKVSAELLAVRAERDAATREVAELRRCIERNADEQPTQAAIDAFQVCRSSCL